MRKLPIGDDRFTTDSTTGEEIVVRSPYDGHEIDRVPACVATCPTSARHFDPLQRAGDW